MIRAACHIHSDWSYDGKWSIADLATEFKRRGYRVLMITDHDRGFTETRRQAHRAACAAASSDEFFVLPGIEYSDAANRVHVLVWGDIPFLGENTPTSELLAGVKAANGLAVLAHPRRKRAWEVFDPAWADGLLGIEVWNRKTDGWAPSDVGRRLQRSTQLMPFVGMDFHDRQQFFPLAMNLELDTKPSEESVLRCLKERKFAPHFRQQPLARFSTGWTIRVLAGAEFFRRSAAHTYRRLRKRRSA